MVPLSRDVSVSQTIWLLSQRLVDDRGQLWLKNPDDYHSLHSGCLVVLMPQPSLLVFSLPLKLCSHSSVDGKKHITLTLCRAELSILDQLPLHPHLEGTLYLIAAHSRPSSCPPPFFFPSVICLFLFLSLSSPSIPLPPLSPFCSFFYFHWPFQISVVPYSVLPWKFKQDKICT